MHAQPFELSAAGISSDNAATLARVFVIGGEELLRDQIDFWIDRAPASRFYNEYGPTEAVVGCCVHEVRKNDLSRTSIPIGQPIPNSQMYILDDKFEQVL